MNINVYIKNLICECTENNIHINNSYTIKTEKEMLFFLNQIKNILGVKYKYTRSFDSMVKEWYAHNILYNFGLFRNHTKDVDLNEDEKIIRKILYNIIYFVFS